jgi:hypothetical protein
MDVQTISAIGGLTIGAIGIISSIIINTKLIKQKNREDEKKEIYKKLNDFYGPLILLRNKSKELYNIYSESKDSDKTTLEILMNDVEISPNNRRLLGEIVEVGSKCEELILHKSGLVDDPYLRQDLLPKAATHFFIFKEAFEGHLKGEYERFKDHTFPAEIDKQLELKVKQYKGRLSFLNG